MWDAATGARLAQLPDAGYLRAAAFSPDGRYLLAGYDEGVRSALAVAFGRSARPGLRSPHSQLVSR